MMENELLIASVRSYGNVVQISFMHALYTTALLIPRLHDEANMKQRRSTHKANIKQKHQANLKQTSCTCTLNTFASFLLHVCSIILVIKKAQLSLR